MKKKSTHSNWFVVLALCVFDLSDGTLTPHYLAKHHVLPVKMRRRRCRYEELRAVRIGPSVRHRQQKRSIMLTIEYL